jgi:tetratricopeptide (TPR) repeat protein
MSWLADGCLITLFMALTFLLGAFPLKDVDFYWHLRTGDLIRQTGEVPHTDIYTYTREGTPWIDLHWLFQIAISWVYARAGIVGLGLAKCAVTCVAVLLLVSARRREWPVWAMLLAWLPALLVLSGRMYIRPETLSLLYLSIFLAVVTRWQRYPWLAFLLPVVQVAWVNSQGLFVFGPIVLLFALIDAAIGPGAPRPASKAWWRTVLLAFMATCAACFVNPFGISGALYPLELASTMANPVFSRSVGELTPVKEFIRRAGWFNLPLQLHLATILLGALSFLVPLTWIAWSRFYPAESAGVATEQEATGRRKSTRGAGRTEFAESKNAGTRSKRKARAKQAAPSQTVAWRLSPFRVLLFATFCFLSMQATRNSHQFAAVVGSVTAWNFGEWAAVLGRRRSSAAGAGSTSSALMPRLAAGGAILLLLLCVGTGGFYALAGEGRTIGLGEQPLWFPHEAARFAGKPGMPDRFLSFHNGHASLFEYYHGPGRKVYTDPRLEIAGADLFERYTQLEQHIKLDLPGWETELDQLGRPVILVDHEFNSAVGATLLRSAHWRCVWFDSIAAVFVHDSYRNVVQADAVDFAARHFRPDPASEPRGRAELKASARALRNYVPAISPSRPDLARPLVLLGLGFARRILGENPDSIDGWKALGQIELFRNPPGQPSPRFRMLFDPVIDLSLMRSTFALRRALEVGPYDALSLLLLKMAYDARLMNEAALPVLDRIAANRPTNLAQLDQQRKAPAERLEYERKLGPSRPTTWRNLSELDQIVTALLAVGRAESAADLLERANPPQRAPWEVVDRVATLRLHLGEPGRARALWQDTSSPNTPGLKQARIALTYLIEGDFETARALYQEAIGANPNLFEAHFSLAVLEQDAGRASAAYQAAQRALRAAEDESARAAARTLASSVSRFRDPTEE